MASRPPQDPGVELGRIRKQQQQKPPRAPLRVMIASDPNRPVRTFTLPRALPKVVLISITTLLLATVVLACGSWKLSGTLGVLERRVRAMVQAADSVALAAPQRGGFDDGAAADLPAGALRPPRAGIGRFMIESNNTGERMEVAFNLETGEMEPESYRRFRHLMRCLRTGAETPIDPRLIDLLYRISQRTHQKIVLVSGFRAPMFSLATLSYHTRGMAADIRIPGMTPLMVRDLAESMGVGGVGYYPVSGFVHVDVREVRSRWIDYGRDRQDGEGAEHGPEHGEAEPVTERGEALEVAPVAPASDSR